MLRSRLSTSVGLVGLPNVGKSTLFNALVGENKSYIANYPFATIEPCQSLISVPDDRLQRHALNAKAQRIVPDYIEVYDIAGLVKGAAEGKGLGNAFLGHIRAVDAIVHVVRCFNDPNILHVNSENGPRDPLKDVEVIELELILADLESVEKRLNAKRIDETERANLVQARSSLQRGVRPLKIAPQLQHMNLLTLKPVLYALITDNVHGDEVTRAVAQKLNGTSLPISARLEAEVAEEPDLALREDLRKEFGLDHPEASSLRQLSKGIAKLLHRRVFYTVGEREARSWPLAPDDRAVNAAERIHSDIAKNLVNVEIKREVHDKGRMEGKDYVMQDGDIAFFRHRG